MTEENGLESQLRKALDSRTDALGADSLSRLRQARHHALESRLDQNTWQRPSVSRRVLPGGALASLLAVAFGLSVWLDQPTTTDIANAMDTAPAALIEMAAGDVDIELLEEIEFYDWLVLMQDDGDSA